MVLKGTGGALVLVTVKFSGGSLIITFCTVSFTTMSTSRVRISMVSKRVCAGGII